MLNETDRTLSLLPADILKKLYVGEVYEGGKETQTHIQEADWRIAKYGGTEANDKFKVIAIGDYEHCEKALEPYYKKSVEQNGGYFTI